MNRLFLNLSIPALAVLSLVFVESSASAGEKNRAIEVIYFEDGVETAREKGSAMQPRRKGQRALQSKPANGRTSGAGYGLNDGFDEQGSSAPTKN
jgi:hypothetical protein